MKSSPLRWFARFVCLSLLAGLPEALPLGAASGDEPHFAGVTAGEEPPLALPVTRANVAYKTSRDGAPGRRFNLKGDLTLTGDAIELATAELTVVIPLDEVRVLSFGKTRGDVDTDWVLLSVGRPEPVELVGLKDGGRLGFGGDTRELFETLRRYVRQQGAAQYDVPEGWVVWDPLHPQVTLAVPEDWHAVPEGLAMGDGPERWGTVRFSGEQVRPGRRGRASSSPGPGFSLTLEEAPRGASCEGFAPKARARLLRAVLDGWRGQGTPVAEQAVRVEPWQVDGCQGLRISGAAHPAEGRTVRLDERVAAHHRTLYRFGRRGGPAPDDEAEREVFSRALDNVRFSVGL